MHCEAEAQPWHLLHRLSCQWQQAREIASNGGDAQAIQVDVTDNAAQQRAFDQHLKRFSTLDIVCLNAGILEKGDIEGVVSLPWLE